MQKIDTSEINHKLKDRIKKNYLLGKNSWFGIGGCANIFFQPNNKQELILFLKNIKFKNFIIIGSGSNILFRDSDFDGVVIKLGKEFCKIEEINSQIVAGAGALKSKVSEFAKNNEYSNFEFLSSIPGTVGGGVSMNAGCFDSEMSDIVSQISVIDLSGDEKTITLDDIGFDYRKSELPDSYIIIEILFKKTKKIQSTIIEKKINLFKKKKNKNQPSGIRTGGSTFKNPISSPKAAWELIKETGCDELSYGNAKFSSHHCNFIDNSNLALSSDIEKLISETQKKIKKNYGINLELEIKII
ncbi:UDP-N-acetylmuramate dehydrogenase [Pelagibacteraceae bacterium]|nr:UDP-N-acetylmuramate dehydrogenase [Pelagibacteraceae bacterium]